MPSIDAVSSGRRRPLRPRSGSGPGRNTAPEQVADHQYRKRLRQACMWSAGGPCRSMSSSIAAQSLSTLGCSSRMCLGRSAVVTAGASASGRRVRCRSRRSGRRTTPTFGCAARWRVAMGAAQVLVVHQPAHLGVPGDQPGLVADRGEDLCGSGPRPADCSAVPATAVGGPDETATGRARSCIEAGTIEPPREAFFELSVLVSGRGKHLGGSPAGRWPVARLAATTSGRPGTRSSRALDPVPRDGRYPVRQTHAKG